MISSRNSRILFVCTTRNNQTDKRIGKIVCQTSFIQENVLALKNDNEKLHKIVRYSLLMQEYKHF